MIAHPPLKWAGGKTKLLSSILPLLPAKIGTYYEPFIGGGAVFFALAAEGRFERARISDINAELVNLYKVIQSKPQLLMEIARTFRVNKEDFLRVRANTPTNFSSLDAYLAARTVYLNKTCFNGLYRVNKKSEFNVPWGKYENPTLFVEENILACSDALGQAEILQGDFEKMVWTARRGDVVYFDPPYVPVSKTANFVGYAKDGFGPEEQERLRDVAKRLDNDGVYVLLSNSDTPFVRELYKGFRIAEVQAPRRVNSKGGGRGNVGELLIATGTQQEGS